MGYGDGLVLKAAICGFGGGFETAEFERCAAMSSVEAVVCRCGDFLLEIVQCHPTVGISTIDIPAYRITSVKL